jgi:hypothetical protein
MLTEITFCYLRYHKILWISSEFATCQLNIHTNSMIYNSYHDISLFKLCDLSTQTHTHTHTSRTKVCKNSVNNTGTGLYNKLPINLKSIDNILHFRRKLKLFLLQQTFYSVEEYFMYKN